MGIDVGTQRCVLFGFAVWVFCVITKGKQLLLGSCCVLDLDCDILHVILMDSPKVVVKMVLSRNGN